MKISANDLRVGNVIEYRNKLWVCTGRAHTQPGKGGAYIQAELKALLDGQKLNERFRSSESLEKVHLEETDYQFLFAADGQLTFMNQETFEQISLSEDMVGEQKAYLQDGMIVSVQMHDEKPISVSLPGSVVLEIVEADPVVKGQTATSSYKPAVLSNGVRIMVPPFIEAGTRVVVNTADNTYVERAKE
jgi:elongation factor P